MQSSERSSPLAPAFFAGSVLALSVGLIDTLVSLSAKPSEFSSFRSLLAPLSAATVTSFLVYGFLWGSIALLRRRNTAKEMGEWASNAAVFVGLIFVLSLMNDLFQISFSLEQRIKFLLICLFSAFMTALIDLALRAVTERQRLMRFLRTVLWATPFWAAATVGFLWFCEYKIGTSPAISFSLPLFVALGIYIFVCFLAARAAWHVNSLVKNAKLFTLFLIAVIVSPLLNLTFPRNTQASLGDFKSGSHPVRHILLITIDTLRGDAILRKGDGAPVTPHIDELAKEGMVFDQAFAPAPWTWPSVTSMMTGLSPTVLKLGHHVGHLSKVPDELTTLAEYLRGAGYYTAAIGRNAFLLPESNISQGFLEYHFFPKSSSESFGKKILKRVFPERFQSDVSTKEVTHLTTRWLRSNRERDFFLWVHYFDPHGPYSPPAKFLPKKEPVANIGVDFDDFTEIRGGYLVPTLAEREWIAELYWAEVRWVDEAVGKVIQTLKELGLYDESLIILSSDHGEELWEHDLIGHGHSLYNEMLRVPLIVKLPSSSAKEPTRVDRPVTNLSLVPTLLDICQIDFDAGSLSAPSLVSLWQGNSDPTERQPIVATGLRYYENQISVQSDETKYIRSLLTDREELYDLTQDPGEQFSITTHAPEKIKEARELLAGYDARCDALRERHPVAVTEEMELDESTMENLRSLGYVH